MKFSFTCLLDFCSFCPSPLPLLKGTPFLLGVNLLNALFLTSGRNIFPVFTFTFVRRRLLRHISAFRPKKRGSFPRVWFFDVFLQTRRGICQRIGLWRISGPILYSRRDVTATTRGESDYHFIINQRHTTFSAYTLSAALWSVCVSFSITLELGASCSLSQ